VTETEAGPHPAQSAPGTVGKSTRFLAVVWRPPGKPAFSIRATNRAILPVLWRDATEAVPVHAERKAAQV
jgi:hypothetical protein